MDIIIKLVERRKEIMQNIYDLKQELRQVKEILEMCQHQNVQKEREYDENSTTWNYYCPICESYIGYDIYREYCIRNNLEQ